MLLRASREGVLDTSRLTGHLRAFMWGRRALPLLAVRPFSSLGCVLGGCGSSRVARLMSSVSGGTFGGLGGEWVEGTTLLTAPRDLAPATVSLEMASPTEFRGKMKRLLNKKKLPKGEWEEEKKRIEGDLLQTILSIPGAYVDETDSMWHCSLQYHDQLLKVLKKCGAKAGGVPKSIVHVFGTKMFLTKLDPDQKYLVKHLSCPSQSVPEHLSTALFPFQREGVEFALRQGGRCLIGYESAMILPDTPLTEV
jgi:hypothetical protein